MPNWLSQDYLNRPSAFSIFMPGPNTGRKMSPDLFSRAGVFRMVKSRGLSDGFTSSREEMGEEMGTERFYYPPFLLNSPRLHIPPESPKYHDEEYGSGYSDYEAD